MALTEHGVSTTKRLGQFAYEEYYCAFTRKYRVQWDYRDAAGVLHGGTTQTLEEAEQAAEKFGYRSLPSTMAQKGA